MKRKRKVTITLAEWDYKILEIEKERTGMTYGQIVAELLQEHKEKIAQKGYLESRTS